jgi:phage shock protein A
VISVDRDLEFMRLVQRDFVRSRATEHAALARQIAAQDVAITDLNESVDELRRQLGKLNEDMSPGPQEDVDDTGC